MRGIRYSLYGTGGIIALFLLWLGIEWSKVSVANLSGGVTGPVVVYASDRQTILRPVPNNTHREFSSLDDFSPHLPKALIASEDSRYYWHLGVDPIGILRALLINYQKQEIRQGASTITQQLARSLFPQVGRQNTAGRKLREILVALKLETFYSKDDLLLLYLNRVYLGVGLSGFEDTAQFYFDKSAKDLTIAEAATLVSILPAPNNFNPVKNRDTATRLRDRVIERMKMFGMITTEEAEAAKRSRIQISRKARTAFSKTIAPYYYSYVFNELRFLLGEDLAKKGNFIVETSLAPDTQKKAEIALRNGVREYGASFRFSQGGMVTLNSHTGEILALTGGIDYGKSQFNRATQAQRQPGSTFKVFAYAAAIEDGISPNKLYSCASLTWKGQRYKPCERSGGNIDMYRALAQSENAVALRVAQDVGLNKVVEMAQRLGIKSKLSAVPGLVLGQSEVNILEITGAYATFANRGVWNRPHAIRRILDTQKCTDYRNLQTCEVIYSFDRDAQKEGDAKIQAISPRVADTMNSLLQGVVQSGTGRAASLGLGEAGKTGTTNRGVDLWFVGYLPNPSLVTGIWLGNDNNSPTRGSSGQAAQLWKNYIKSVISNQ
ncbi:MAG: penicillin-binding protein [Moorea sp. SIO2B7]|nr:penicillin-binding protein [Moorena sp. SIO2B7]